MPRQGSVRPGGASRLGLGLKLGLLALLVATGLTTTAFLVDPVRAKPLPPVPSATGSSKLAPIERYFNNIKTMVARFHQRSSDGWSASGTFYLSRPGRMRLEYDPPLGDFLVADGWYIYHWDDELESQSQQLISDSLVRILLRQDFRLTGEVLVIGLSKRNNWLEVTVVLTDSPQGRQLTLFMAENPLQLIGWQVREPQGVINVELSDVRVGVDIAPRKFIFEPPEGSLADD